jgi:uncharacterized protein (DUF1778 family)
MARSEQLQIRVTPREKAQLKRFARAAGWDVSAYVLVRALPSEGRLVAALVEELRDDKRVRFALAELNDLLSELAGSEIISATGSVDLSALAPWIQNYVAAMIEHAAHVKGVTPPGWTRNVSPLDEPHFATSLKSLRTYLLRTTPVAFKRRNIFANSGIGTRV